MLLHVEVLVKILSVGYM